MHFKKGTIKAIKEIFSYADELSVFESRMSYEEFKKEFVEYSGNEAEILREFWYASKCNRSFIQGRTDPRSVKGHLPDDFYSEWDYDRKTKDFKSLFLGKYLTQEFFETNPQKTLTYGFNCLRDFPSSSEPIGKQFWDIDDQVRSLQTIQMQYEHSLMHFKILKSMQEENSLIRKDGFYTQIKEVN